MRNTPDMIAHTMGRSNPTVQSSVHVLASTPGITTARVAAILAACALTTSLPAHAASTSEGTDCHRAAPECFVSFSPAGENGDLGYYTSQPKAGEQAPVAALIALHGYPRDVTRTFDSAIKATEKAGRMNDTVVVAPLFQVARSQASRCQSSGTPEARPSDITWTCGSWMQGGVGHFDKQAGPTSFAALDALVDEVHRKYPSVKTITLFGFSAGAQTIQHYIGFSNPRASAEVRLRFIVSDPGSWLYFDSYRPHPPADPAACPDVDKWKYGIEDMPANLGRSAAQARAHYAQAEVHYMQGEKDTGKGPGAYYKILDKSCAAQAQGPYRLERGLAYAEYDRKMIAPQKQRQVTVVPDCGHSVACVLPSRQARGVLFPDDTQAESPARPSR